MNKTRALERDEIHLLFRIVKSILKEAGIDESVHTLRKTGGTHYYVKSNYDLIATQQFLGHSNPSITRK